jgi:hypothetical protein
MPYMPDETLLTLYQANQIRCELAAIWSDLRFKIGQRALLAPGTRDDDDITLSSELLSLPSSVADLTAVTSPPSAWLTNALSANGGRPKTHIITGA